MLDQLWNRGKGMGKGQDAKGVRRMLRVRQEEAHARGRARVHSCHLPPVVMWALATEDSLLLLLHCRTSGALAPTRSGVDL
jgi:hypothetical protein